MAKFGTPTAYVAPERPERENPFTESIAPLLSGGVDTQFPVTFDADDYKSEKLLIQSAANKHGFSLREVETDYEDGSDAKTVNSIFRVRPMRKRKGEKSAEGSEEDVISDIDA